MAESGTGKAMAKQHDVRGYDKIAWASSQRAGRQRWAELALYHKADGQPRFIAEVIGATEFADEERRVKRAGGDSAEVAMRLFDESGLKAEVLDQVGCWLRTGADVEQPDQQSPAIAELIDAAQEALEHLEFVDSKLTSRPNADRILRLRKSIEGARNG
jgi:hypothetical protein